MDSSHSKKKHHLDHSIGSQSSQPCVINAGVSEQRIDSDHLAVKCKLRVTLKLKEKTAVLDFISLANSEVVNDFCQKVLSSTQSAASDDVSYSKLSAAMSFVTAQAILKKKRLSPG